MDIKEILKSYNTDKITIGVLGGHSALDVCSGGTKYGFDTIVVCEKGREKTYEKYYRRRDDGQGKEKGCVGNIINVDKFANITDENVQEELRKLNTVFIQNRYFWVYCDYAKIENEFKVPIFGLRGAVKLEERDSENNQYFLLEESGIRIPKMIRVAKSGFTDEITKEALDEHFKGGGGPLIVKVNEAKRKYERAFFVVTDVQDYMNKVDQKLKAGHIDKDDLVNAVIEEFVIGAQVNFNYFYSTLTGELELMGTDTRRQTNLDGFLRLDAQTQMDLIKRGIYPSMVETGHLNCTVKESILEKAFEIGEKFVETMKHEHAPGIIGPFALQGAMAAYDGREEFVVFDVSMRLPGSPGTKFSPYSGYLYGESIGYGERIAREIKRAVEEKKLEEVLT